MGGALVFLVGFFWVEGGDWVCWLSLVSLPLGTGVRVRNPWHPSRTLIRPCGPTSPSGRSAEGLGLFQWVFVGGVSFARPSSGPAGQYCSARS